MVEYAAVLAMRKTTVTLVNFNSPSRLRYRSGEDLHEHDFGISLKKWRSDHFLSFTSNTFPMDSSNNQLSVIRAIQAYILKMVKSTDGMKVLLMDDETVCMNSQTATNQQDHLCLHGIKPI